jgi:hypothetical protein
VECFDSQTSNGHPLTLSCLTLRSRSAQPQPLRRLQTPNHAATMMKLLDLEITRALQPDR